MEELSKELAEVLERHTAAVEAERERLGAAKFSILFRFENEGFAPLEFEFATLEDDVVHPTHIHTTQQ